MAEGDIGAVVAELEFDEDHGAYPRIIHISGEVYAIVYEGTDLDGWIKTVTISAAGALALVGGGALEIEDTDFNMPSIIHVASDVYAVAYTGDVNHGQIKTVTISAAGALALVGGGILEFDGVECFHPNIIHVENNVYAVAYQATGYDGWIKTVTISAAGALALVGGSGELEFDLTCSHPDIIHVASDVYAVAYLSAGNDGWIKTVTISAAGILALVGGGALEFDIAEGYEPRIIHISGDVYAIAYRGVLADGWLKTVTISAAGALALTGQSLEFELLQCDYPDIIHIADNMYTIAYAGPGGDGWLKTMTIETVSGKPQHLMMMGIG